MLQYEIDMVTKIATSADIESITELLREFKGVPVDKSVISTEFSRHFSNSDDNAVLLIEDDSGIQGIAVVALVYRLIDTECRIDKVYVREMARGKGYGKQIMKACNEWAWEHGADEIEFTSRPSREAANKLYQSAGYELRNTNVYRRKRELT